MSKDIYSVYEWKSNYSDTSVPAQKVGERLEELSEEYGGVTPQILLDDSRPVTAVCHPLYEWDDAKAAEKYRLRQSGDIIRNLVVVEAYKGKGKEQSPVIVPIEKKDAPRAFSSVINENGDRAYMETAQIVSSDKLYAQLEAECRKYIKGAMDRYSKYGFFKDIIEELLDEIK